MSKRGPTISSLRAAVQRASKRGPVGPNIGAMSRAERDEHLFGISAASGIEAEGQDRKAGIGAKHESPTRRGRPTSVSQDRRA